MIKKYIISVKINGYDATIHLTPDEVVVSLDEEYEILPFDRAKLDGLTSMQVAVKAMTALSKAYDNVEFNYIEEFDL